MREELRAKVAELAAENERLQEALRDRDGIIAGLAEMIQGKTKPFSQIQKELAGE
jgi:hypothetical protein